MAPPPCYSAAKKYLWIAREREKRSSTFTSTHFKYDLDPEPSTRTSAQPKLKVSVFRFSCVARLANPFFDTPADQDW